jgi:hypothetical protein
MAHDSHRLVEPDAEWEITLASLRRASSKHESNDRVRESLRRLRRSSPCTWRSPCRITRK